METKDILKALRKSKGFANAKDFCDVADISYNTYQNYETGKRLPTAEMLMKIAKFYGVSTDYLLGREETPDPMEQLAKLSSMEITEQVLLEKYLELPKASREIVINFMKSAIKEAEARQNQTEQTEQATDTPIKQKSTYTCGELEDIRKAEQVAEQDAG